MKSGRIRTLRGQIEVAVGGTVARKNLVVSDGLINMGLKINKFEMWPVDPTDLFFGILSYDTLPSGTLQNAGDNRQFGWITKFSTSTAGSPPIFLDPDHIINRDLFLTLVDSSEGVFNYLIEMQTYELSDNEAIITIIKETSQS